MNDRIVVAKCANRTEAEHILAALASANIEAVIEEDEAIKVAVGLDAMEPALDFLAQMPQESNKRPNHVGRKTIEWTGRCPACGSMKIAPVEGAMAAASIVLVALWGAFYTGARQIHLRHPVLDSMALLPLILVVSWLVYRRTPNARCDACNTYWKARR